MTTEQIQTMLDYILMNPEATNQDCIRFGYGIADTEIKHLKLEIDSLKDELKNYIQEQV